MHLLNIDYGMFVCNCCVFVLQFQCQVCVIYMSSMTVPVRRVDILLIVGRTNLPSESLFYYDIANGLDFFYYRNTTSYEPQLDYQPSQQQQQEAEEVCVKDDDNDGEPEINQACVYDFLATGNNFSAGISGFVKDGYTEVQDSLGRSEFSHL